MRCEPALLPVQGGRVVPGPAQDQSRHSDGGTQPHAMCSGMTLPEQGSWSRWPSVVPSILTHSVAWAGVLWPGTLQSTSRSRKLAKTLISALVFYPFLLFIFLPVLKVFVDSCVSGKGLSQPWICWPLAGGSELWHWTGCKWCLVLTEAGPGLCYHLFFEALFKSRTAFPLSSTSSLENHVLSGIEIDFSLLTPLPLSLGGREKDCLETNEWRVLPRWFNTDCIKCQLLNVPYPVIRKGGDGLPVQWHIGKYA